MNIETLVVDENGKCHSLNGSEFKNPNGIIELLKGSNVSESKLTAALQNANKCNDSKYKLQSILGALGIVLGGTLSVVAAFATYNPALIAIGNLLVSAGICTDQILRVDKNYKQNKDGIISLCEQHEIPVSDVIGAKKEKQKSKSHIHEREAEAVNAADASPLQSIGSKFSASKGKTIDGSAASAGSMVDKLKEQKSTEEKHFVTPKLDGADATLEENVVEQDAPDTVDAPETPVDTTIATESAPAAPSIVEQVQSTNNDNAKSLLDGLMKAKQAKTIEKMAEPVQEAPDTSLKIDLPAPEEEEQSQGKQ